MPNHCESNVRQENPLSISERLKSWFRSGCEIADEFNNDVSAKLEEISRAKKRNSELTWDNRALKKQKVCDQTKIESLERQIQEFEDCPDVSILGVTFLKEPKTLLDIDRMRDNIATLQT